MPCHFTMSRHAKRLIGMLLLRPRINCTATALEYTMHFDPPPPPPPPLLNGSVLFIAGKYVREHRRWSPAGKICDRATDSELPGEKIFAASSRMHPTTLHAFATIILRTFVNLTRGYYNFCESCRKRERWVKGFLPEKLNISYIYIGMDFQWGSTR